jgi:glyoxylase-like metal-dependent hydrolase (beta-lactamase superfamily II)
MAKTYRIRPLLLTKMEIDMGILLYRYRYGEKFMSPAYCWYIEGADQHIIIDTATDADLATAFRGFPAEKVMTFEEALGGLGLKPEDIDLVIQTHLHWDHCANTPKCTNAKVLVNETELHFAFSPHPLTGLSYKKDLLKDLNFVLVNGHYEVAPGIELIPAPGHSPGTMAVAINTDKGKAIITGFCCVKENFYPPEELKKLMPVITPGTHTDITAAYESTLRIKGLADILIPIHDPSFASVDSIP